MPVCRICLTNDPLQVSLFSEYAQRKLLLTKIRVCLPITITHADTLPVTICSQCMVRLEQFYEYYCKSETSQRILTQGVGIITASGSSRTESYAVNGTAGSVSGVPTSIGTDTCVVSDNGGHGSGGGSITVADQMDPILTQSPQVKRPAVADEVS
uniref:ZAD domain-containing protein n=1 Tax=Anopheles epiroticus TaxID=199890 RepID=A0A182PGK7_9DIPT